MKTFFADTFYFLALLNSSDDSHEKVIAFTGSTEFAVVTTDWVLVELADGLSASEGGRKAFISLLDDLRSDQDVKIVACDPSLLAQGISLYGQRSDKSWSLTDCISFAIMDKLGITEALTADHHFEQAGFVALLK